MSLPPYDQTIRDFERHFQVVLPDGVGQATVGFRDGVWYRLNSGAPHPVPIRSAIILCPHAAGSIVQIVCWWMRENARSPRALDLATELALTVGELARKAIEDDPLGMSLNTLSSSQTSAGSISPLSSPSPLGSSTSLGSSGSFAGAGSMAGASGYDSGSYSTDPYASAQPPAPSYEPAYAAAPPVAATTLIPQITPEMTAPSGRPLGVPRPAGPPPGLTPLPPAAGRPGPANPAQGYGAQRGPMPGGPMPGGRPPMGPGMGGQTGSWDRAAGPDPRTGRPVGGPQQRQPGPYDGSEPRDEFFRSGPPQQRRPDDYGRPQARPTRPEAGRSW